MKQSKEYLDLPACFDFTKKTKTQVLHQFLGKEQTSKIWKPEDISNLL